MTVEGQSQQERVTSRSGKNLNYQPRPMIVYNIPVLSRYGKNIVYLLYKQTTSLNKRSIYFKLSVYAFIKKLTIQKIWLHLS